MPASDLEHVTEQYHRALNEFVKGDPGPYKKLFSRREDVTLANPLGPPVLGWSQVEKVMDAAAAQLRECEPIRFERISACAAADLAYMIEIERTRGKVGGSDEVASISLRATTIFRLEEGQWKIVHRHADPITSPQPIGSIREK
jgi:ketosteroid isomerase-like protein